MSKEIVGAAKQWRSIKQQLEAIDLIGIDLDDQSHPEIKRFHRLQKKLEYAEMVLIESLEDLEAREQTEAMIAEAENA